MSAGQPYPGRPRGAQRTSDRILLDAARSVISVAGGLYSVQSRDDGRLTLADTGVRIPEPRVCCLLDPPRPYVVRPLRDTFGRSRLPGRAA